MYSYYSTNNNAIDVQPPPYSENNDTPTDICLVDTPPQYSNSIQSSTDDTMQTHQIINTPPYTTENENLPLVIQHRYSIERFMTSCIETCNTPIHFLLGCLLIIIVASIVGCLIFADIYVFLLVTYCPYKKHHNKPICHGSKYWTDDELMGLVFGAMFGIPIVTISVLCILNCTIPCVRRLLYERYRHMRYECECYWWCR